MEKIESTRRTSDDVAEVRNVVDVRQRAGDQDVPLAGDRELRPAAAAAAAASHILFSVPSGTGEMKLEGRGGVRASSFSSGGAAVFRRPARRGAAAGGFSPPANGEDAVKVCSLGLKEGVVRFNARSEEREKRILNLGFFGFEAELRGRAPFIRRPFFAL